MSKSSVATHRGGVAEVSTRWGEHRRPDGLQIQRVGGGFEDNQLQRLARDSRRFDVQDSDIV